MVRYILTLNAPKEEFAPLPRQGTLALDEHSEEQPHGRYIVKASYTDRGGRRVGPLAGEEVVVLRNATVQTVYADEHPGFTRWRNDLAAGRHKAHIMFRGIDLTGIRGFTYGYKGHGKPGEIEVRIHSAAGPVISRTRYSVTGDEEETVTGTIDQPLTGRYNVFFIVRQPEPPNDGIINLRTITFDR